MRYFVIFLVIINFSELRAQGYQRCNGVKKAECLHNQGLFTDEELEGINIDQEELILASSPNSQIRKYQDQNLKGNDLALKKISKN